MDDKKSGWRKYQKLNFDSRKIAKRARKAEGATVRHARKFLLKRVDNMREVQRRIVAWLLLVGCLIVTVGLQLIWFQRSYTTTTPTEGGTYAEAMLGPIDTLNPLYASSPAEVAVSKLIFSSLYNYDASEHLHGNLASSMISNKKGDVYTVKLTPGIKWHDGTTLTAEDVVFTVNLIKDPSTRSSLRTTWQDIKVQAIDDNTVQFTLPSAYAAFPHALTFAVLPVHLLKNITPSAVRESTFSLAPVGTGPFEFRLLQTISTAPLHKIVHLKSYADYHLGSPKLNRFELHAYDSDSSIAKALRTGEVTAAVGAANPESFNNDTSKFESSLHPLNGGVYALFNTAQPALRDLNIRRAIQLGTDTSSIRHSFGLVPPALNLPFVNGQVSGVLAKVPSYNPTKAEAMLEKAGWKLDGNVRKKAGVDLKLGVVTTKGSDNEKTLEQLAGQWRKLGINVQTTVVDTTDPSQNFIQNVLQPRNYDVLVYELSIGADPDVYAYWHSSQIGKSGLNLTNYKNNIADDALSSARARSELRLRDLKYATFAEQWVRDVPAIGLYQSTMSYSHTKNIRSFPSDKKFISPQDRYQNVQYWSADQKSVYNTP